MSRIVECVPNISEGRDRTVIDAVTAVVQNIPGVALLDVDPGEETNRTVITLVGNPDATVDAAFRLIAEAQRRIDMSAHSGAHPRMGATDVCPFVPVSGVTMDECAELARKLGTRVGEELGIPVYLYEHAASRPERQNLAAVRAGEYEGLAAREGKSEWDPDFGPAKFNPRSGATAIGARNFLIAYNINLDTRSRKLAHDIALDIRERGRRKRDSSGKAIRDHDGKFVMVPGRLKECKAVGWLIPEYGAAQISMNLTNAEVTPVHIAFDAVVEEATRRGLRVTGSEIVGLVPLRALRDAGLHYLRRQGLSPAVSEADLVQQAVKSLGLDDLTPFDPASKIIEYRLQQPGRLVDKTVTAFLDELAADSPAPGGGSVASLMGALSAALSAMVTNLTVGKKGYESAEEEMKAVGLKAQQLKEAFAADIDRDTEAFNDLFAAAKMKRKTPEEVAARASALREATRAATLIPLGVLQRAVDTVELSGAVAERGNTNSLSDAGVAALAARACAEGAYYNVLINLIDTDDSEWAAPVMKDAAATLARVSAGAEAVTSRIRDRLEYTDATGQAADPQ
ncbi:MAG: glutamate formimidoyltransferase [Gemmatimonadota bacterium]|jgi:glutamate formiminotransferase/formiminotetrahydrofolate cyclodeaminase|nr:glutamate formimidoyltransferase [Gemmatimonadota bacterium]MDP6803459.1 glutamate formimidoyltransferase [Gemmatimonadota bacterium]MDP7031464.1 glutamate formimidoyltransferase [Gemmatimonadota bacterium]